MARWVDVRIPSDLRAQATRALCDLLSPVTFSIDVDPPAAGPEIELQVQGYSEQQVRAALEQRGIPVLAARTSLRSIVEVEMSAYGVTHSGPGVMPPALADELEQASRGILNTSGIAAGAAGPLTTADLERAIAHVHDADPPEPRCPPHLVSGPAKDRIRYGGSARCINCGGVLRLINGELVVGGS